ncbi:acetyltransferase [Lacticaseibacillus paracasei]|nr:acetyltransferase [Lacticaseibacillus paracasei]
MTRSQSQKPTCKDLEPNDQSTVIRFEATYTPVSTRAGSRFHKKNHLMMETTGCPVLSS